MSTEEFYKDLDAMFSKAEAPEKIEEYMVEQLKKADEDKDYGLYISIGNEMIGFYRSISQFEKCFRISEDTLLLMEEMQLDGTEHFATTLLNVATAYRAAGLLEESLTFYRRSLQIYEQILEPFDYRFASLYNNISLLLQQLHDFENAEKFLNRAMEIVDQMDEAKSEQASTRANLALVKILIGQFEEAESLLDDAVTRYESMNFESTDPHYSAALAGYGEICFAKGEYEKALKYYEKAALEVKAHFGENESYQLLLGNIELVKNAMQ